MLYLLSPISWTKWFQKCVSSNNKHSLINSLLPSGGGVGKERTASNGHHTIADMPEHLQFNPWILGGYRAPEQSTMECIKSIGSMHNETINILTHGLPILYVLLNCVDLFELKLPCCYLTYCQLISCLSPWIGSFLYHVFMNHRAGPPLYTRLLQADMAGIWYTQVFGALTTLNASFMAVNDSIRHSFVAFYLCLSIWALYKGLTARNSWQRAKSFSLLICMRAVAFVVRLSTSQLVANSWHLVHVVNQELLPIVGAIISANRFPERFFPGYFDLFFNSHNIMHILVLAGGMHMYFAYLIDIEIVRNGALKPLPPNLPSVHS